MTQIDHWMYQSRNLIQNQTESNNRRAGKISDFHWDPLDPQAKQQVLETINKYVNDGKATWYIKNHIFILSSPNGDRLGFVILDGSITRTQSL
jgi:hypothetical protein